MKHTTPHIAQNKADSLYQMLERGQTCANLDLDNVTIDPELQSINDLYSASEDDPEPDRYFYHTDLPIAIGMGSSSWITDASGAVNQLPIAIGIQYLSYGKSFIYQRVSSYNVRYKFTGKERDAETGFDFQIAIGIGARYYDSELSVWLSVDPLTGKCPSTSPFLYVKNNPIMFVDPNGMIKNPFKSKQRLQAEAYRDKVGGTIQKIGHKKWGVKTVKISKEEEDFYKNIIGQKTKIANVEVTWFYDVKKGIDILTKAGVNLDIIINSSWGFWKTAVYDVRNFDRKLDGDTWSFKKRKKIEERIFYFGRRLTALVFSGFKIFNMIYSIYKEVKKQIMKKNKKRSKNKDVRKKSIKGTITYLINAIIDFVVTFF